MSLRISSNKFQTVLSSTPPQSSGEGATIPVNENSLNTLYYPLLTDSSGNKSSFFISSQQPGFTFKGSTLTIGTRTTTSPDISNIYLGEVDVSAYVRSNGLGIQGSCYPATSAIDVSRCLSIWNGRSDLNAISSVGYGYLRDPSSNYQGPYILAIPSASNSQCQASYDGVNFFNVGLSASNQSSLQGAVTFGYDLSNTPIFAVCQGQEFANVAGINITRDLGRTFQTVTTPFTGVNIWKIVYSSQLRIWVCSGSANNTGNLANGLWYSTDASNWTQASPAQSGFRYSSGLEWSPELGYFICLEQVDTTLNNNTPISGVYISRDGINWTRYGITGISPTNYSAYIPSTMSWSPALGIFCFLTVSNGQTSFISKDGINWNQRSSGITGVRTIQQINWCPQLGCFASATLQETSTSSIIYSFNGANWTRFRPGFSQNAPSPLTYRISSFKWCNELGMAAIGLVNSGNRCYTSSLAARIPTSTNLFDNCLNSVSELGLWSFNTLGRKTPVIKTSSFTVQSGENWIICSGGGITATLPAAASWVGREIMFKNITANTVSCSPTILALIDNASTSTLLPATQGSWRTIVSDGTNWIAMSGTPI